MGAIAQEKKSYITPQMKGAIGKEGEAVANAVETGAIRRFAEAIGDSSPLFNDEVQARKNRYGGVIAPPTFFRSLRAGPLPVQYEVPLKRVLDGGSDWEYFEPVRPGDTIHVSSRIADMYEREGRMGHMLFTVRETFYRNQLGQVVATQKSTGISY